MTPQEAHKIGSDYIVVGRPIIQAENPWDAYHEIKRQWNSLGKPDKAFPKLFTRL